MVQIATGYRVPDTLLSDTEESVVGTQWHQEAIGGLADLLRAVADQRSARWGVCEQIALQGLWHEDGSPYEPRPDVLVLAAPLVSGDLASVPLAAVGAPLFIAEVVSHSTRANDLGDKRQAYAAIGAREYLIFDPSGHLLPTPVQAWRLGPGGRPLHPLDAGSAGLVAQRGVTGGPAAHPAAAQRARPRRHAGRALPGVPPPPP